MLLLLVFVFRQLDESAQSKFVDLEDFRDPLPSRVIFLRGLPDRARIAEDGAVSERKGADRNLHPVKKFARLLMTVADGRHGIEDRNRGLVSGKREYLLGVGNGLKIVGLRAPRNQHKVGDFRGGKGGLLVARGRVDNGEVDTVLLGFG
jgi:hypothetical protein